jgi:hypothetical protein
MILNEGSDGTEKQRLQDRDQLLNVTAQTEGQIVSTRMLLLFASELLNAYLDQVDSRR